MKEIQSIPRLSWHDIADSNGNPISEGAIKFGEALRTIGFAILTDTPYRKDLLRLNYDLMKRVFDLGPDLLLKKYSHPEIGYQRGYMPTKTEVGIRAGNEPDDKEVMAFGSYRNIALDDVPGYIRAAEEYYSACQDIGYILMHVLSIYLDPAWVEFKAFFSISET